jgi:hypothetical protein
MDRTDDGFDAATLALPGAKARRARSAVSVTASQATSK